MSKSLFFPKNTPNTQPLLFENQKNEKLLTAKELAEALGISVSYVKKLKRTGIIRPSISFGRFVRYSMAEVVASLKRRSYD